MIRIELYNKLQLILPAYSKLELIATRKKKPLSEDVYVIGYCVISGLEDLRLRKVVKIPETQNETIVPQEQKEYLDNPENIDPIQLCLSLKNTVEQLKRKVSILSTHVSVLEDDLTTANDTIVSMRNLIDDGSVQDTSVAETIISNQGDATSQTYRLDDTHTDAGSAPSSNQITPSPQNNSPEHRPSDGNQQPLRENGFRLSNEDRRKIRRGWINNQLQSAHDVTHETSKPIVGRAQGVYRLQSADQPKPDINPVLDLVYVGRLAHSTSEQHIREHLTEIGVPHQTVADVLKLKCRNNKETSFCISLSDKNARDIVFDSTKWPSECVLELSNPVQIKRDSIKEVRVNIVPQVP